MKVLVKQTDAVACSHGNASFGQMSSSAVATATL